jgi:hypothetical protein
VEQLPQCAAAVFVSTQLPSHRVSAELEQPLRQAPASQACPAGHAVPQAPQFLASLAVSTQEPPHSV